MSHSMSTGSAAIPLLKAAPEPDQIADRLDGRALARAGALPRAAAHVADDAALARAVENVGRPAPSGPDRHGGGARELAERRFVSVDRLDAEARAGIERSARASPPRSARRC